MRQALTIAIGLLMLGAASEAEAQAPQPPPQAPTTVQLPTFHFFTVNTTVSVPDKGSASLGGISRASSGSTTRGAGPLRSRAIGGGRSASTMSVHATIIDHAELDRAVLAEAARRRGDAPADRDSAEADFLSAHVGRAASAATTRKPLAAEQPSIGSVAEIRRRAAERAEQRRSEVAAWLAKAESLEAEGKSSVAKIDYQMIARRTTGDLKATAVARIALIETNGTSATVVRNDRSK